MKNRIRNALFLLLALSTLVCTKHDRKLKKPSQDSTQTTSDSTKSGGADVVADSAKPATEIMPPVIVLSYEERRGKNLYDHYCAICHGEGGVGDGFNAYNLNPRPRDLTNPQIMDGISDEKLFEVISQGGRGVNKSNLMPSWGGTLKQEDIRNIISFVRTLKDTSTVK
jgi:cytochrome c5